ncbi:MAG: peptidoglycan-binding protein [Parvularculaceae bacterium]|nr:peptidoglycan-binding protein [Parvularculaceae bacterium]
MRLSLAASALVLTLASTAFAAPASPKPAPTSVQRQASNPIPAVRYNTASNIRKAEQKLKDLGKFNGAVDGRFGAQFRTSLMTYQKENKLTPTGRLNAQTMKSLGV